MVFWLFGRSGAGKTTLAKHLQQKLSSRQGSVVLLDGDAVRLGICADLGFDEASRDENHRRIAEISLLLAQQNFIVIVALMTPQFSQREKVGSILGRRISWIYVDTPLNICVHRDPKGLYARCKAGELAHFSDFPFDPPDVKNRDLHIKTDGIPPITSQKAVLNFALDIIRRYHAIERTKDDEIH